VLLSKDNLGLSIDYFLRVSTSIRMCPVNVVCLFMHLYMHTCVAFYFANTRIRYHPEANVKFAREIYSGLLLRILLHAFLELARDVSEHNVIQLMRWAINERLALLEYVWRSEEYWRSWDVCDRDMYASILLKTVCRRLLVASRIAQDKSSSQELVSGCRIPGEHQSIRQ